MSKTTTDDETTIAVSFFYLFSRIHFLISSAFLTYTKPLRFLQKILNWFETKARSYIT